MWLRLMQEAIGHNGEPITLSIGLSSIQTPYRYECTPTASTPAPNSCTVRDHKALNRYRYPGTEQVEAITNFLYLQK